MSCLLLVVCATVFLSSGIFYANLLSDMRAECLVTTLGYLRAVLPAPSSRQASGLASPKLDPISLLCHGCTGSFRV